ncbi:MAG: hypothetical protein AAGI11_16255 [Pseudomonadota bacterium]
MANDELPSIVPKRDTVFQQQPSTSRSRKSGGSKGGGARPPAGAGGAGIWARLFITVALVVAAVACAWAWQLQEELKQTGFLLERYEGRIADLEDLLSDTDETMNQSSAAQAAQLRMLDSEVRKLWDARKKSNATLASLEKTSKARTGQLSTMSAADKDTAARLKTLDADMAKLRSLSGDLDRLMASARSSQNEVERVADTLNSLGLNYNKLDKRVQSNEEWVGSINAFRRQVNERISRLESSTRATQTAP